VIPKDGTRTSGEKNVHHLIKGILRKGGESQKVSIHSMGGNKGRSLSKNQKKKRKGGKIDISNYHSVRVGGKLFKKKKDLGGRPPERGGRVELE